MRIVVVGAGQLGSRHLQALSLLECEAHIEVIDMSKHALEVAESRMNEMSPDVNRIIVNYHNDYDCLKGVYDAAIVATGANVRRMVVETLLEKATFRNILLEKVLFQSLGDYEYIGRLFEQHNVRAWVNCPQRTWSVYQEISSQLPNDKPVSMEVAGSGWGLACNAIHYIDLFSFLTKQEVTEISTKALTPKVVNSKREGFVEFEGSLHFETDRGDKLTLTCYEDSTSPVVVQINSATYRCVIKENLRQILFSSEDRSWEWITADFVVPFQSQQTQNVLMDMIERGECKLTQYIESSKQHKLMISGFNEFLERITGKKVDKCPIT